MADFVVNAVSELLAEDPRRESRDWYRRRNALMYREHVENGRPLVELAAAFGMSRQRAWAIVSAQRPERAKKTQKRRGA